MAFGREAIAIDGPLYAYLRKSRSDDPSEPVDVTLRKHRVALEALSKKLQLPISKTFEEVVTGDSLYVRPEMMRLLEAVEAGECGAVLVMDIDRLGRGGMRDQGIILDAFKYSGTKIITPDRVYDLNDDSDEEMVEFKTFFSRREYKTINKRLQRGLKQSVKDGAYLANAPFGYKKVTVEKRPTLAIDEGEAQFVRMIYDMYVNQGCGCNAIAEHITALGARPRRSDAFGRGSIEKIIQNPVYTGKVVWNRAKHIRKGTGGSTKHIRKKNPESEWIIVDGMHPPIIDNEIWEKANKILKGRYHPPSNTGAVKNPLAGVVTCAICGSKMVVTTSINKQGRRYGYLHCTQRGCNTGSNINYVEAEMLDQFEKMLIEIEAMPEAEPIDTAEMERALEQTRKSISSLTAQKNKLYDLLEQEIYTVEVFTARAAALDDKMRQLRDIESAQLSDIQDAKTDRRAERIKKIKNILKVYTSSDAAEKNALLKDTVDAFTYRKEKGASPKDFRIEISLR